MQIKFNKGSTWYFFFGNFFKIFVGEFGEMKSNNLPTK